MVWTEITRAKYRRDEPRYSSDLTDAEWKNIEPHLPKPNRLGRPRKRGLRSVVDGILYIATTGCPMAFAAQGFSVECPPFGPDRQWDTLLDLWTNSALRHREFRTATTSTGPAGDQITIQSSGYLFLPGLAFNHGCRSLADDCSGSCRPSCRIVSSTIQCQRATRAGTTDLSERVRLLPWCRPQG